MTLHTKRDKYIPKNVVGDATGLLEGKFLVQNFQYMQSTREKLNPSTYRDALKGGLLLLLQVA